MTKKVYQIQIALKGSKPKIWRRVVVDPDISLLDFHKIIQTTMGWTNTHLHVFSDGVTEYSPGELEVDDAQESKTVKLHEILNEENSTLNYEYDFGDGWEHNIILEKIATADDQVQIPKCIAGRRNCPPEDCGGIWAYADMLKILKQPRHKEYKSYMKWLGGEFDPEYFNIDEINQSLQKEDFGSFWF